MGTSSGSGAYIDFFLCRLLFDNMSAQVTTVVTCPHVMLLSLVASLFALGHLAQLSCDACMPFTAWPSRGRPFLVDIG